jgi:hypothetical protein
LIPHPVFPAQVRLEVWWRWPGTTRLVIGEYNKYLAAITALMCCLGCFPGKRNAGLRSLVFQFLFFFLTTVICVTAAAGVFLTRRFATRVESFWAWCMLWVLKATVDIDLKFADGNPSPTGR